MTASSENGKSSLQEDELVQSCRNHLALPENLLKSRHSTSARKAMADTLNHEAKRVFDDDERLTAVKFIDIYSEDDFSDVESNLSAKSAEEDEETKRLPEFEDVNTLEDLQSHLHKYEEDPKWRYVSILAESSKEPLNISLRMFKYLCSYHQIPPTFLNSVFSFGSTLSQFDCSLATFSEENTLFARRKHSLALPKLGRSGREIRHSFLLRSVEPSDSVPNWKWGIRPLAVYHSFDVETGRATWITLKGNELIENRMIEAVSENSALNPSTLRKVSESFAATLEVHCMLLDWVDENWRWYINAIEAVTRNVTKKPRTVKVDDQPHLKTIKRNISQINMEEPVRSTSFAQNVASAGHQLQQLRRRITFQKDDTTNPQNSSTGAQEKQTKKSASDIDKLMNLEMFSIREMQKLQEVTERVQEARLVLDLNLKVVKQIREHYQNLINEYEVPELEEIRKNCRNDFLRFLCRSKAVETNIEIRASQLDSLLALVREGKDLYDGILQFRNLQINKIYAESAHQSSQRMQTIAYQTKQETSSMHIVTVVTLIFLPWTFIAAFFQSGIIKWAELDIGGAKWRLNKDAFSLFAMISLPLMALTFGIWLSVLRYLSKKSNARQGVAEKPASEGV
ncbi:Fc.00g047240.m01.CDS01 [Cosmosporella sp. VM-42]